MWSLNCHETQATNPVYTIFHEEVSKIAVNIFHFFDTSNDFLPYDSHKHILMLVLFKWRLF